MIELDSTSAQVARLTRPEREARLALLLDKAHAIVARAVEEHITSQKRTVAGTVILFSGGNDSTTLGHIFKDTATHTGHANTGIGIEQTREFVRTTSAQWGLPLLEFAAPHEIDSYRSMVLAAGFPGPGHHFKMYQRLKERGLRVIRNTLVNGEPHRRRVVFLAGRRRDESQRRMAIPESDRVGSAVFVSPLVNWTKTDLSTYRLTHDVPVNEVSDLIHMSGECLCGCFAKEHEREELTYWFPGDVALIDELEAAIADRADIPEQRRHWGWNAELDIASRARAASKSGLLCSSCQPTLFDEDAA